MSTAITYCIDACTTAVPFALHRNPPAPSQGVQRDAPAAAAAAADAAADPAVSSVAGNDELVSSNSASIHHDEPPDGPADMLVDDHYNIPVDDGIPDENLLRNPPDIFESTIGSESASLSFEEVRIYDSILDMILYLAMNEKVY